MGHDFKFSICLTLVGVLCAACPLGCDSKPKDSMRLAVSAPQAPIVDKDYCFQLTSPGFDWKLLAQAEAQQIVPDAVAGMYGTSVHYGVIIVEPFPSSELADYVELVRESLSAHITGVSPTESVVESVTYLDRPAAQITSVASINGVEFRYSDLLFIHQGHVYQLFSWAPSDKFSHAEIKRFRDSFALVDGTVRTRSAPAIRSYEGIGRRVIEGRFESPVYRLALQPKDGWQLLVGASLAQSSPDAEVGLGNWIQGTYLTVTPELVPGIDQELYRDDRWAEWESELGVSDDPESARESVTYQVGDQPTEFAQFADPSGHLRCLCGIVFKDDIAYDIQAWFPKGEPQGALQEIEKALGMIEFTDRETSAELARELLGKPVSDNIIGPHFSVRGGVYRDFERSLLWTKPSGFWRLSTGEAAALGSEGRSLFAMEPQRGIHFEIVDETKIEENLELQHRAALQGIFEEDHPVFEETPRAIKLRALPALVSQGDRYYGSQLLRYRVITFRPYQRACRIVFWGLVPNMQKSAAMVDAAEQSFLYGGAEMAEFTRDTSAYRDNRVGFELRLPGWGWNVRDNVVELVSATGNVVAFEKPGQSVTVMGMTGADPNQDPDFVRKTIEDNAEVNISRSRGSQPVESIATLAGQPCSIKTWKAGRDTQQIHVLINGRTTFLIDVVDTSSGKGSLFEAVKAGGFRLLD